jgi:hypothetical protein
MEHPVLFALWWWLVTLKWLWPLITLFFISLSIYARSSRIIDFRTRRTKNEVTVYIGYGRYNLLALFFFSLTCATFIFGD